MKSLDELQKMFEQRLTTESARVKTATGDRPEDFLYDQAESVEPSQILGYVYVVYKEHRYGPARETWGALDADKNKSTVLIQTTDGKWYKLWFFSPEVKHEKGEENH